MNGIHIGLWTRLNETYETIFFLSPDTVMFDLTNVSYQLADFNHLY
jgi:hypothetical protein